MKGRWHLQQVSFDRVPLLLQWFSFEYAPRMLSTFCSSNMTHFNFEPEWKLISMTLTYIVVKKFFI